MTVDTLPRQVQFPLAAVEQLLTPIEFLQPLADRLTQALDLVPQVCGLEVGPYRLNLRTPTVRVAPDRVATTLALPDTRHLPEIDLRSQTRAQETAGVPGEGPAHGCRALPVVVQVLLGFVRVVPDHLLFESATRLVVLRSSHVGSHDPRQRVQHRSRAKPV